MKLQILSDLHIDSYIRRQLPAGDIPETDADIIILAGDISNSDMGVRWAIEQSKTLNKPMIYVTGNHEYFDENFFSLDKQFTQITSGTNVQFLQKTSYEVAGVRFLGCTLWTGFELNTKNIHYPNNQPENNQHKNKQPSKDSRASADHMRDTTETSDVSRMMAMAKDSMRDYRSIYAGSVMLTPEHIYDIHHEQKDWLLASLKQAHRDGVTAVVITHHGVSPQSIAEKYQGHPNNPLFINDLSDWMHADFAPKLWIHGHVHDAFDYTCGHTRVVVNPRAYPAENSSTLAFDWSKVVEV